MKDENCGKNIYFSLERITNCYILELMIVCLKCWLPSAGNSNCDKVLISVSLEEVPHQARHGEESWIEAGHLHHGPGNSDCDRSRYSISRVEVPNQDDHNTCWGRQARRMRCSCRNVSKLKVTTGCDTAVKMSQARVTRALSWRMTPEMSPSAEAESPGAT